MKSIVFGLTAALLAVAMTPAASHAASEPKPASKADEAKKHTQGMAEAPPLIQQAGVTCTPTDAIFMGEGKTKDAAGKDGPNQKIYELVCQEGLGYVLLAPAGGTPQAFDCLAMSSLKPKPGEKDSGRPYCRLPANEDPVKGVAALAARAGLKCPATQAHYMGSSGDGKLDQYEVACADGTAAIIQSPRSGSTQKLVSVDCLALAPGTCSEFLPKDKLLARLSSLAAPANRPCQASDARYMGTVTANQNSYYELACAGDKPGYVLQLDANNKYVATIDCARATSIAGGCNLTSASAAQTNDNETYTKLAKQIGYSCAVKSYHSFGTEPKSGREVVELSCSDHPDGAIAMLPIDAGQKGEYFNCIRAAGKGLKCALTPPEATYSRLSSEITAQGKSCQVSNAQAHIRS